MRIGIVSIYDNQNIGNRLQNYALQQMLLQYSEDVRTIRNQKKPKSFIGRLKKSYFITHSPTVLRIFGKKRSANIVEFTKKYIRYSKRTYSNNQDEPITKNDSCDYYCSGSDQVWNPNFGRSGMFNYLGFANREKTFSYAASFGIDKIPEKYAEDVKKGLEHIKYISVREDAGKHIVEELTGRTDVQVLVDPTMLLTTDEWDKIAEMPNHPVPEKYLLTYFLGEISPERKQAIKDKADELGCAVINLMDKNDPFHVSGPSEFVYLIKNATFVCTDSFHCSVFSFLYGRPIMIFDRKGNQSNMGSRLETLANKFSLQHCLIKGDDLPQISLNPDYSVGYAALELERNKSKAFLDMVLKSKG